MILFFSVPFSIVSCSPKQTAFCKRIENSKKLMSKIKKNKVWKRLYYRKSARVNTLQLVPFQSSFFLFESVFCIWSVAEYFFIISQLVEITTQPSAPILFKQKLSLRNFFVKILANIIEYIVVAIPFGAANNKDIMIHVCLEILSWLSPSILVCCWWLQFVQHWRLFWLDSKQISATPSLIDVDICWGVRVKFANLDCITLLLQQAVTGGDGSREIIGFLKWMSAEKKVAFVER